MIKVEKGTVRGIDARYREDGTSFLLHIWNANGTRVFTAPQGKGGEAVRLGDEVTIRYDTSNQEIVTLVVHLAMFPGQPVF